jgi:hypothetical protein
MQSENFSQANWDKSDVSITTNTAVSPDGYTNADTLTASAGNATHFLYDDSVSYSSGANTMSVFVKYNTNRWVALQWFDGATAFEASFDIQNGVKGVVDASASSSITSFGSGWYRISLTATSASGGTGYFVLGLNNSDAATLQTWTATGSESVYIWGAQFEAGAYATSYIPTLGASVTRVADAAFKTGISSLIGQTEGTLFAEYKVDGANPSARIISVSDGTTANRIVLLQDGLSIRVFVAAAGVGQVDISFGTWIGSHKIAVAYANNDLVVFLDGVLAATDTSISVPACSAAQVGTFEDNTNITPLGGVINQALIFKTRLTNSQLAELTA